MLNVLGLSITPGVLAVGALRGLLLGLSAVGIVLVFRATRVVNLAQGQLGALVAAGFGRLVIDHGVPYFAALPLALLAGVLAGILIDLTIVSRLRDAPRVVVLAATVGLSQLLVALEAQLPLVRHTNARFPTGLTVDLSSSHTTFAGPEVMVLAVAPAVVVALTLFLALTPTGLAIRATVANPEAAALAGISGRRVSATVWGIAGVLAVLASVLTEGCGPHPRRHHEHRQPRLGAAALHAGGGADRRALLANRWRLPVAWESGSWYKCCGSREPPPPRLR